MSETFSYDEVRYPGHPFPQTHPERLATIARLFGMNVPMPSACRVLEIGCGDGGNLIPMAHALPGSTFVGIDLSAAAIADAEELAKELGLTNITFQKADILAFDVEPESFDYVISHGVYSWVPAPVREGLLALARRALAPNGVAYVSYNALPGGHIRRMVREMLLFHVKSVSSPADRLDQARAFLRFLIASQKENDPWRAFLEREFEGTLRHGDALLYHDDLSEENEPVLFSDFAGRAARHGLKYLGEADFFEMGDLQYPEEVRRVLRSIPDIVGMEQLLDFVKCRRFRQTLLVRSDAKLVRDVDPMVLESFMVSSEAAPEEPNPSLANGVEVTFRAPRGGSVSTDLPFAKAALIALQERWPEAVPLPVVAALAAEKLGRPLSPENLRKLYGVVLSLYATGVVSLWVEGPKLMPRPSERPRVSTLARLQASRGPDVTSLRHVTIHLEDEVARLVLCLLDGTRTAEELAAELTARGYAGDDLAERVQGQLGLIARMGLFEA